MRTHVKRHHPEVASGRAAATPVATTSLSSTTVFTGQLRLEDVLQKKMPLNSERAQLITRHVGVFIAKDLRPFSVVENCGFSALLQVLEPRYVLPSRPYFSGVVIPTLYEETKAALCKQLRKAISIALTTDGWTSCCTESYLTVTAHFVCEDWSLANYVLQTRQMNESHTAVNIASVLTAVVADWQLARPIGLLPLVTDNASNMVLAAKEGNFNPHIGCFAHTLNLATQNALKINALARLLGRVRKIVAFFHRSTTAAHLLKVKQELLKLPPNKLIIDVSTRWNSSYDMLERFLQQQPAVTAALMSKDIRHKEKDICTMAETDVSNAEDVVNVLRPIKTITTILCDTQQSTVSMIMPMKEKILKSMKQKHTEDDSQLIKSVKEAIADDIEKRYADSENFLLECTALDPCFRSLPMLNERSRVEVFASLRRKTISASQPSSPVIPAVSFPPRTSPPARPTWTASVKPTMKPAVVVQSSVKTAERVTPPDDRSGGVTYQDSEEWDDDWDDDDDDDDSSTTTDMPELSGGGNFGLSAVNRERLSSSGDGTNKFGTVRKFSRFSGFAKQGGEAYLFDLSPTASAPDKDHVITIVNTADGLRWQPLMESERYSCEIKSPRKESKYHGMKSFIAYQVTPSFSGIQVSRRYKHFDWLHDRLEEKFTTLAIPPLPDKQVTGRYDDEFVVERMRQLLLWLDRMCRHPVIANSETFLHFMSCTEEKGWKSGKRRAEKDGFKGARFFLTIQCPPMSHDIKSIETSMDRFGRFSKSMDDSVRQLSQVGEENMKRYQGSLQKGYRKLGGSLIALAKSFEFDERPVAAPLTHAIEHTGRTLETIGELTDQQPKHDMIPFLESLQEYKGLLSTFPEILSVHRTATQKIQENAAKLSDPEMDTVQSRVDLIAYVTTAELNEFQANRVGDFKLMMQDYLRAQIQYYQQITSQLQDTLQQYDNA